MTTVLVVGATGSTERLVVEEAIRQGYTTRALVRDRAKARALPADAEVVVGDVTRPDTLAAAVDGIDAVVLTLGSHGSKTEVEKVDSGGVRNILNALGPREARIALMTAEAREPDPADGRLLYWMIARSAGYDGAAARCRARMRRTGVSVSGASTTTVRAKRSCSPRRRSSKSTMK